MRVMRLFNEKEGADHLRSLGVEEDMVAELPQLGISSICNLLAAIKTAKYFEMGEEDLVLTVFTDSMEMYRSRVQELTSDRGAYRRDAAIRDFAGPLASQGVDFFKELDYYERKAIHNLKYYTWVEQQGKTSEDLMRLWDPEFWRRIHDEEVGHFDQLIEEFNREVGLL